MPVCERRHSPFDIEKRGEKSKCAIHFRTCKFNHDHKIITTAQTTPSPMLNSPYLINFVIVSFCGYYGKLLQMFKIYGSEYTPEINLNI